MDCVAKKKKRYPTLKMADDYADVYNRNPFLKEEDMLTPYHCKLHEGWHVGHEQPPEKLSPVARIHKKLDRIKDVT